MTESRSIRVLIVDDEPLARKRIKRMLATDADVEIVGDCATGREAVAVIRDREPDLIFLDIQMPEMDGFSVLKSVAPERMPFVIFVTAYDQYALRAFEFYALDYLLKPFDRRRFEKAMQRARERILKEKGDELKERTIALLEEIKARSHHLGRLVIKAGGRVFFIKTEEIDWIEAEGKYVRLHVGRESHLLREAIGSLEAQLDPEKFLRIHRSTIVNIDRIRELQPWFHNEYRVILRDGTELMLSRSCRKKLGEMLGGHL
ncbi:MAG TPA: LytTR family DNA-binding domain-containing protein [Blastocatellia bacterium]|nr:LytTR family DNA-binding domain-containing protein [Blastocatellia bacterium]